jgi:hypothetical protein
MIENFEIIIQLQSVIVWKIMRKKLLFFFSCDKQKLKIKWRVNICKTHKRI